MRLLFITQPSCEPTPRYLPPQVLEAVVRLLSGEPTAPVGGRPWSVLPQAGCGGRYVPEAETEAEAEAELALSLIHI